MTSNITMAPPPPPKRQAPSPNQKLSGGTTPPPISQAEKYQHAYMDVWTKLSKWKQVAIEDDRKKGIDNGRLMNEFLHEVTRLAEQS
jgi:hypothetical protein